jgi:hypothetical protein
MSADQKERLISAAEKAMRRLEERPIIIHTDVVTAVTLVGTLQLALRHPEFKKRPTWGTVRNFVDSLIQALSKDDQGFREFLKLGDHPDYDI